MQQKQHVHDIVQYTTCLLFIASCILPVLPRPGESLDEGGDCVVVPLLAFVLVHGGGGV